MSDVRCTKGCKGAMHLPGCEIYQAAMMAFESRDKRPEELAATKERRRLRDAQRDHHKKPPEELLTPEQRSERTKSGPVPPGRKPGYVPAVPWTEVQAVRLLKLNVRPEYKDNEDICSIAGYTFERAVQVISGTVPGKRANVVLKGISMIREEICVPKVTESKFTGSVTLESQVLAAAKLAAERKGGR